MTELQATELIALVTQLLTAANGIGWLLHTLLLTACWLLAAAFVGLIFLFKNQKRFW